MSACASDQLDRALSSDAGVPTRFLQTSFDWDTSDAQSPVGAMAFEVRTVTAPANVMGSIREAVREVDASLPLIDMSTEQSSVPGCSAGRS